MRSNFCIMAMLFFKNTSPFHHSIYNRFKINNDFWIKSPRFLSYFENKRRSDSSDFTIMKSKNDKTDNMYDDMKHGHKYLPKTENQHKYIQALSNKNISLIVSVGPAGTGKTLFSCMYAIKELKKKNIEKIILTRPVISVDEEIGFLPGDINTKMAPWTRPIFDIFLEFFSQKELDYMLQNNVIEICPLAFMRGRTFKNTWIIADEMQNSSPNQIIMITTRLGNNSKIVITGDLFQSDRVEENGLKVFLGKLKKYQKNGGILDDIAVCSLENNDIERSKIVAKVLNIWFNSLDNVNSSKNTSQLYYGYNSKNSNDDNDAAMIPLETLPKKWNNINPESL